MVCSAIERAIEKETLARTPPVIFRRGEGREKPGSAALGQLWLVCESAGLFRRWPRRLSLRRALCDARQLGSRSRIGCPRLQDVVWGFLRSLYGDEITTETIDSWLCAPENARALVGAGTPDESTAEGLAQQERLAQWVRLLEDEQVMEYVIASYHTVPLLGEYAPQINPQQLKNALISRPECDRVERMIQEHGKLSPASLYAAVGKVAGCRGAERSKVSGAIPAGFFSLPPQYSGGWKR